VSNPLRQFILNEEGWWVPLGDDGRSYPSHRHDAEAVLNGMMPGVVVAIYPPGEGPKAPPPCDGCGTPLGGSYWGNVPGKGNLCNTCHPKRNDNDATD
jgi:hypothetical protein